MEVVSLGVEKLWDRLSQEYEQYKGVEDQVLELKSNLNLLKSFLKDADAKKHTDKLVRHCVEEIKEIVYDAEDMVETCILKEKVEKKRGIMKRIKGFASKVVDRRELASDIRGISKRILKVIGDMKNFGVETMFADGSRSSHPLQEREREMQQEFARNYESDFVGLDANVKKLVGYLVGEDDIQIVSVTGMGGLGKTTLARQVFNHEDVKHHFDGLAWVCVSKDFTRKNVWQAIFRNLKPNEEENKILEMTEATLLDKLSQLLETSRALIVIDDIWKKEDWNLIKLIFPPKKGWTVLLTSRDESIVVNGGTSYINFKVDCLTFGDSWTLFQRIAFPRKDTSEFKVDEEMEELGKQMIKHCGGLPLAVKVLGGLLAANYRVHDWKRLSENIGSHIVRITSSNKGSIDNILSMSFEGLPSYLKQCFLYLSHYPEDYAINVGKLSYNWAAEGIQKPSYYDGATIRDVGDSYVEELVRRNMVTAKRDIFTSRFETLQLHDMMREVCLLKVKEDNFLQIAGSCSSTADDQSPHPSRRIVSQNPDHLNAETDITNPKLRSLVIVRNAKNMYRTIDTTWRSCSSLTFSRLQLLRVLDLYATNFEDGCLPSDIGKLIHLRYLGLERAGVSRIPSALQNLKLLIYLNLQVELISIYKSLLVPNILMGMRELRYLALPSLLHEDTKLELSKLEKLETLENFSAKHSSIEDLHNMSRLRILSISLTEETSIETLSSSIGGMIDLEHLTITTNGPIRKMREEELSLGFFHLRNLILSIYMPRLPDQQHFPYRLTLLNLRDCGLEEDPMPILEKLRQLKEVTFGENSFVGRKMVCSGGGFPQLQKLAFFRQEEWEEWIVEESSMPLLHSLKIWNCGELKELPDGLKFITSLKNLDIRLCHKLKQLPDVQHFPSHLTIISIDECSLEVNPMPILEKLLHLKKVYLHESSFSWGKLVCSAGGFPQLHELDICRLLNWEELVIEEGSMPLLHTLHLGGFNLPELPDGLRFITSLKSLDCELSGTEWEKRVSKEGEDYYKVQHIPYVRIDGDDSGYGTDYSRN